MIRRCLLSSLVLLAGCGEEDAPLCNAAEVRSALADARSGGTVRLGACTVAGPFELGAGVTLAGAGVGETIVEAAEGEVAVMAAPGASEPTTIRALTIRSEGRAGIVAVGAGSVRIEAVEVRATRGIAVGLDRLEHAELVDVVLHGPVLPEDADDVTSELGPEELAVYGLVALEVADLQVEGGAADGFAAAGAALVEGAGRWQGSDLSRNVGAGLAIYGGTWSLDGLVIDDALGSARLVPTYGAVFSAGAAVDTTDLSVRTSEGYGLLLTSATGRHERLVAQDNSDAAVWIQDCDDVTLVDAALTGNLFGGVVAARSSGVTIEGGRIDSSRAATTVGPFGRVDVGDGLQLLGSTEAVRVAGVSLAGNERIGLLVDLDGGSGAGIALEDVTVDGADDALGAIQQNGEVPDAWDAAIERLGVTADNDTAFVATGTLLGVRGLLGPNDIPRADTDGLRELLGPND